MSSAEVRAHDRPRDLVPADVWDRALDDLVARLPDAPVVADLGVGSGAYGGRLAERGVDVVGVDINLSMLAAGEASWPRLVGRLACGDVCRLPLASARMDLVVIAQVLHLMANWREAIREAGRLLRTGGMVAVSGGGGTGRSGIGRHFREILGDVPPLPGASSRDEIIDAFVQHGFQRLSPVRVEAEADQTRRDFIDRLQHNPFAWHPAVDPARLARAARLTREEVISWGLDLDEPIPTPTGISIEIFRTG